MAQRPEARGRESSELEPSITEVDWPKPAARPSLRALNFFWSTWLIANITMNSTISSVIMSA